MAATSNEPVTLLKAAVSHLTDYISNHNLAPQDALQKVAEEFDLSPNFIKRASEAINVALTHSHFKKHASSRDTEFAITDADKVVSNIFGDAVKTASEKQLTDVRLGGKADSFRVNIHKLSSPKYKTAYEQILKSPSDVQVMSIKGVLSKSAATLDTLEKNATEAYNTAVDAEFRMKTAFSQLVNDFSKDASTRQSWVDFEKQAYAEYGACAVPYLDLLHKSAGFKDSERQPRAENVVDYKVGPQTAKFGKLLDVVEEYGDTTKVAAEAKAQYESSKSHVAESFQQIGKAKLASMYASGELTLLEEIVAEKKAEDLAEKKVETQADPVAAKAARWEKIAEESKNLFGSLASSIDFGKNTNGAISQHTDNVKRQHLLTELLATDPILSETDPHHMAQAYAQMVQLSPELSMQKEVVRGQLRQMAAGQALNPHDASLLAGANNEVLKTHQLRAPAQPHKPSTDKK